MPVDANNRSLQWSSSNTEVAAINENGRITAKSTGTTIITAKSKDGSGVSDQIEITVGGVSSIDVTNISLSETILDLTSATTHKLVATVLPENATNKNIKWSSSDKDIAYVTKGGMVTAGVKEGTAVITAEAVDGSGIKAECEVTVSLGEAKAVKAKGITLDKTKTVISEGEQIQLTAMIDPSNVTVSNVEWISSNEEIIMVDNSGIVTALKEGTATVTAKTTDGSDKTAVCKISVFGEGSAFYVSTIVESIRSTCALLSTDLSSGIKPEEYGVYISKNADFSTFEKIRISNLMNISRLLIDLKKLSIQLDTDTEYYYRVYMIVDGEEYISKEGSFHTIRPEEETEEPEWTPMFQKGDIINFGHRAYGSYELTTSKIREELKNADYGYNLGSNGCLYWVYNGNVWSTIPVRWIVIEESRDDIKVMSEYVFSGRAFSTNISAGEVRWDNSELRQYINKYGYMQQYFLENEMNDILAEPQDAETIYTADKITIPSYEELGKYSKVGDLRAYFYEDEKPNITTPISGFYEDLAYNYNSYTCAYWTRTSNRTNYGWSQPVYVDSEGDMRQGGRVYYTWSSGIRPVIRIRKSSAYYKKAYSSTEYTFKNAEPLVLEEGKMSDYPEVSDPNGNQARQTGLLTLYNIKTAGKSIPGAAGHLYAGDGVFSEKVYGLTPKPIIYTIQLQVMPMQETLSVSQDPNTGKAVINWYRQSDDCGLAYQIERAENENGPFEVLASDYTPKIDGLKVQSLDNGSIRASYKDNTVDPEKEYWYRVQTLYAQTLSNNEISLINSVNGEVLPYSNVVHVGKNIVPVDNITITPKSKCMIEGDSSTLTSTLSPDNATDKTVYWSSSDTSIVTVELTGMSVSINALRPGTAVITASSGGVRAEAEITVKDIGSEIEEPETVSVNGISVSPDSVEMNVGNTQKLVATVSPADATDKTVSWISSKPEVATVDNEGLVTAVSVGDASITVKTTDGGYTATCDVKVNPTVIAVTGVSISPDSVEMIIGDTMSLTATVSPADATDKTISWSSSNSEIVSVDDKGVITAVAEGDATVTVTSNDGGKSASCAVKVLHQPVAVKGIRIDEGSSLRIKPEEEKQLHCIITPSDASDKTVTWSSSEPAIVSVSENGTVKAVADSGKADITVKTKDGGFEAKITVEIVDKAGYLYAEFVYGDEYIYTGSAITPEVRVFNDNDELVNGVDYTISYKNNINVAKDPQKAATVTVTGKTFAGSMTRTFTILPADLNDADVNCSDIIRIKKNSKPVPEIYYKNIKLAAKDYDVTYDPTSNKGKYATDGSLTITGKGNFEGTREFAVLITTPVKIKVTKFKAAARTYNGEEQFLDPSEYELVVNKKVLTEGNDYTVEYLTDTVNAGTVKVAFIGTGEYTGTVIKTFKINPDKNVVPDVDVAASAAYTPTGVLPAVNVSLNGKELVAGKDYKLSYSGNKNITDKAKVTVSFLGNYKGAKSIAKTFAVTAPEITAAGGAVYCADMTYTKAGKYLAAPYVNVNGTVIAKGDYNVTYKINGNDISKAKIDDSYFADSNVVKVDVTIDFNKKTPKFTGTLETSYDIVKAEGYDKTRDLSKAKITITDSETGKKTTSLLYTGRPVELGGRYKLSVTFGSGKNVVTLVEGTDFEIIKESYSNNVNKGKATVVINAKDGSGYFGSKVISFSITNNKWLSWF